MSRCQCGDLNNGRSLGSIGDKASDDHRTWFCLDRVATWPVKLDNTTKRLGLDSMLYLEPDEITS
jgi:hypothetical protein